MKTATWLAETCNNSLFYYGLRFIPLCLLRLDTNAVYRQTQHLNAIQQCATRFSSSEPSSGTFTATVSTT